MSAGVERGIAWGFIVLISVLVHELGHALAMRAFGYGAWIELHALGGLTHWVTPVGHAPTTPKERFLVTLAGPMSGLALGGLLFGIDALTTISPAGLAGFVVAQGVYVNLRWSLINLAPVLPWDGGLLLDSGLEIVTGKKRPTVVGVVSVITALVGMGYAILSKNFLLGYFAFQGVLAGWQLLQRGQRQTVLVAAWQLLNQGQPAEAEALARTRLEAAADPREHAQLLELIAWAQLHQKDHLAAARTLDLMVGGFVPSVELRARIAAAKGDIDQVITLLEKVALDATISPTAFPLLVSALLANDQPDRVVAVCKAAAERDFTSWEPMLHEASTRVFAHGDFAATYELCSWAATRSKSPVHAFNAACALARLGKTDEALSWLTIAVDGGYAEVTVLETDADIASVRALPQFADVLARARQKKASAA